MTSYSESAEVSEADLLASAPNLTVGRNQVRLVGREYHLDDRFARRIGTRPGDGIARASGTSWSLDAAAVDSRCCRLDLRLRGARHGGHAAGIHPDWRGSARLRRGRRLPRSQLGVLEGRVVAVGSGRERRVVVRVRPHPSPGRRGRREPHSGVSRRARARRADRLCHRRFDRGDKSDRQRPSAADRRRCAGRLDRAHHEPRDCADRNHPVLFPDRSVASWISFRCARGITSPAWPATHRSTSPLLAAPRPFADVSHEATKTRRKDSLSCLRAFVVAFEC